MIILTKQQEQAIEQVRDLIKQKKPIITIAGFAGTGKTTLVQYIIEALNYKLDDVAFATFTGKASLVLRQKNIPAVTLHSLLYMSYLNRAGVFVHSKKRELDYPYKLIVIDEISMVSNDILKTALQHRIPIIALGDIGQLPPIGESNNLLSKPDIILTEILRQEADNPIIQLSMDIREGKSLQKMKNSNVIVIDKTEVVDGMFLWADQILCGYNITRKEINNKVRTILKKQHSLPEPGEKIICTKNYWNISSEKTHYPLVNGTIGYVQKIHKNDSHLQIIDFKLDFIDDSFKNLKTDVSLYKNCEPNEEWIVRGNRRVPVNNDKTLFDWGYAITTHKFQGSQAEKIMLFEERLDVDTHKQWLYTAITRATSKIIIVRR